MAARARSPRSGRAAPFESSVPSARPHARFALERSAQAQAMLWYGQPNSLSYIALVLWAPITLLLFARLRPPLAAAIALVGGMLFLPEVIFFNPPLLPELDKRTIPPLAALVGCLLS